MPRVRIDRVRDVGYSAYALVTPEGKSMFVGMFATETKAEEWVKARGWQLVKKEKP